MKGLSASQIAGELGGGVTRNAVIGKVHRLKLAARIKPATSSARTRSTARTSNRSVSSGAKKTASKRTVNSYSTTKANSASAASANSATALKQSPQNDVELKIARQEAKEVIIPPDERVNLLELTEDKCKWPIGDPLHSDFHFCGRKSLDDKPYCEFHSKRAYHKMDRKKR